MDSQKDSPPQYFYWQNENLYVDLLVQTYATHDEISGVHGSRLKIRLASTPVAGKINDHLLKIIAEHYGVPLHRVHLTKGHQSRMKQVCINSPQNNVPEHHPI